MRLTRSGHKPTLNLMNLHAKIAASKHECGSKKFTKLFEKFIEPLKKSQFDHGYLEGDATDLSRAYWAFLYCIKDEVTATEASQ